MLLQQSLLLFLTEATPEVLIEVSTNGFQQFEFPSLFISCDQRDRCTQGPRDPPHHPLLGVFWGETTWMPLSRTLPRSSENCFFLPAGSPPPSHGAWTDCLGVQNSRGGAAPPSGTGPSEEATNLGCFRGLPEEAAVPCLLLLCVAFFCNWVT